MYQKNIYNFANTWIITFLVYQYTLMLINTVEYTVLDGQQRNDYYGPYDLGLRNKPLLKNK